MRNTLFIIIFFLLFACQAIKNAEYSSIDPANPPVDIKMMSLKNLDPPYSVYDGDYLLLFRSENTGNARFGGFFIFISSSRDSVLVMSTEEEASYILGIANGESTSVYNTGIDAQIALLFSDYEDTEEIIVNEETFTVTVRLEKSTELFTGNWLTMRTYLYDSTSGEIMEEETSMPGNAVQIP